MLSNVIFDFNLIHHFIFFQGIREEGKPKLPKNAYFQYLSERRPEFPKSGLSYKNFLRKVGSDWKEVSDDKKKKYQEIFLSDLEKYKHELISWKNRDSVNS